MSHPPIGNIPTKQLAPLLDSGTDARTDSFSVTVILWDRDQERLQLVAQIVKSCGANPREIKETSDLVGLECSLPHSVALVALGESTDPGAPSFGVIQALSAKGFKVIAYASEVFALGIGTRCRALLSGSSLLLDSSAKTFPGKLLEALTKILRVESERHSEEQQFRKQMKGLGIIGESPKMMSVFRWVNRVSTLSDFPVLIAGETGTGKELIACALHKLDAKRRRGPFIAANCSAISAGLAESELFGHRRGAFTGAAGDRKGLFRSAEGGVLFLDEIGELSEPLQAKLLRVLQEARVLGVGFDHEVSIDVRVIAATNRSLEEMVQKGRFREDLYHRLNVLSVEIPPLRDRFEDVQPLIEHFLEKYSSLNQSGTKTANSDFVKALMQVGLSGNARQLENFVRNALLSKLDDSPLSLSDLTPAVWEQLSNEISLTINHPVDAESKRQLTSLQHESPLDSQSFFFHILDLNAWNLSKSLRYCERLLLKCVLQVAHGNQSEAARLIGITPRSVYNKVQRHELNR